MRSVTEIWFLLTERLGSVTLGALIVALVVLVLLSAWLPPAGGGRSGD